MSHRTEFSFGETILTDSLATEATFLIRFQQKWSSFHDIKFKGYVVELTLPLWLLKTRKKHYLIKNKEFQKLEGSIEIIIDKQSIWNPFSTEEGLQIIALKTSRKSWKDREMITLFQQVPLSTYRREDACKYHSSIFKNLQVLRDNLVL